MKVKYPRETVARSRRKKWNGFLPFREYEMD